MAPKILIVEDESIVALDIKQTISMIGYRPAGIANDFKGAIKKIEADRPDLILIDIKLKGEEDGLQLAKAINSKYKLPFIFVSAFSDIFSIDQALSTNPVELVFKPISPSSLKEAIEKAFAQGQEI